MLSAFRLRAYFADWGARLTDRRVRVVFCGDVDGWTETRRPFAPYMRVGILPQTGIHCLLSPDRILSDLRRARPRIVSGYPSILADVAALALDRGDKSVRPRFVQSGGEPLQDGIRRTIAAAFDAPVFDAYSSTECNLIAWECPKTGLLHLSEDSVIVEVLDPEGGPAAEGEVVVTVLHSFEMPFIRFAIGDRAIRGPSPCPCGAPFATLRSVTGRTMELFELSDGRRIHPYAALEQMFIGVDWMRRFRLSQPTPERLRIEIIPNREIMAEEIDQLSRRATKGLGLRVEADLVTEIPPQRNGKLGPFVPNRKKDSADDARVDTSGSKKGSKPSSEPPIH